MIVAVVAIVIFMFVGIGGGEFGTTFLLAAKELTVATTQYLLVSTD